LKLDTWNKITPRVFSVLKTHLEAMGRDPLSYFTNDHSLHAEVIGLQKQPAKMIAGEIAGSNHCKPSGVRAVKLKDDALLTR
jgi:hypothetical protein